MSFQPIPTFIYFQGGQFCQFIIFAMQGVIKKFLYHTLFKYSEGEIDFKSKSSSQGLIQFEPIQKLKLNTEIIKNACLPLNLESLQVNGLQISVSGKDLINAKFTVKVGSIVVNVLQLPNQKDSIQKLLKRQQKSKIKAFILDLINDKIKDSKNTLYNQILIRILNNISLTIGQIKLEHKRQETTSFEVNLAKLTLSQDKESTKAWKTLKAQSLKIISHKYGQPQTILELKGIQGNRVLKSASSSDFALFDLEFVFDTVSLNIDSLIQILDILSRADYSGILTQNLSAQIQVEQLEKEKQLPIQQTKVEKTEEQKKQEKIKIVQEIQKVVEGKDSNVALKDIASPKFNSFLSQQLNGLFKKIVEKQKIGLGALCQKEKQILNNFNAYANSASNLPFLRLSIKVKSLQIAIAVGQEIRTDFSFSIVQYEEKNILQLKKLQKANHSVINVELKNITGQQKTTQDGKQKTITQFTIKQIKINQNRQYVYNSKQNRCTLQKKIKISSFQLSLNSKIDVLNIWAAPLIFIGYTYIARQAQLEEARKAFSGLGNKQDYQSVVQRTPNYLIFERTQVNAQACRINLTLRDEQDKEAFRITIGWSQLSAWINRAAFKLSISTIFSLQFRNQRSQAFEPIVQPFKTKLTYQSIQLGYKFNESNLHIEPDQKSQLKINASPQLIIALNSFIGEKQPKPKINGLVFKNQLNRPLHIRYKTTKAKKLDPLLIPQTDSSRQLEDIVSFSLGLSENKFSQSLTVNSLPYKTIVSVEKKLKVILLRESNVLRILYPLVIYDCLPQPITVQFNQGIRTISQKVIKSKATHYSNTYEQVYSLEFKVKVDGYGWSQGIKYNKINDENNVESEFELVDLDKNEIKLNYRFKKNKQTQQYALYIYCKKFIVHYLPGSVLFQGSLLPDKNHTRSQSKFKPIKGYSNYEDSTGGHVVLVGSQIDNQIQLSWHTEHVNSKYITETLTPIFVGGVGNSTFIIQKYEEIQKEDQTQIIGKPSLIRLQVSTKQLVPGHQIFTKQIVIRPLKLKFKNSTQGKKITIKVFQNAEKENKNSSLNKKNSAQGENVAEISPQQGQQKQQQEKEKKKESLKQYIIENQTQIDLNPQNKYYITIGSETKQNCISLPFGDKISLGQDIKLEIQKEQLETNYLVYAFLKDSQLIQQTNKSSQITNQQKQDKKKQAQILSNNLVSVSIESIFFSINFNFDQNVTPYQSLVVTLKRFKLTKHQTEKGIKYGLKLGYFQVDQMYPHNLSNPVILKSSYPQSFLNIIAKATKQNAITELAINLRSIDVNFTIDAFYLFDSFSKEFGSLSKINSSPQQAPRAFLTSVSSKLKNSLPKSQSPIAKTETTSQTTSEAQIQLVKISPITLRLSAQADINKINLHNNLFINILMSSVGAIKNNANRVPIHITGLQLKGFKSSQGFITPLISHYQNICASQFYSQFRGIVMRGERLDNLGGICRSYRNITNTSELELEVFNQNLDKPKIESEESGIFTFISQSTNKISDGLAFLTFDKEFKEHRSKELNKQPQTALQGLEKGGKALWNGFEEGFTGIFTQPYKGAKQEGALGFVKGVGKGLAGLVVKPITGICDCISSTAQGIRNSNDDYVAENLKTMRYPRVLYTNRHILKQYSRQDSKLYYIISKAYSLQKKAPVLYGAYQYCESELLAFLQSSIVLVDLDSQQVEDQLKYSQLEVKVDDANKTLTFKKKGSSPLGCEGCNQYELTIEDDTIRKSIADFVRCKVWNN